MCESLHLPFSGQCVLCVCVNSWDSVSHDFPTEVCVYFGLINNKVMQVFLRRVFVVVCIWLLVFVRCLVKSSSRDVHKAEFGVVLRVCTVHTISTAYGFFYNEARE